MKTTCYINTLKTRAPPQIKNEKLTHSLLLFIRYHYGSSKPRPFFVLLKVGQREFIGEGATRQTARHNAAMKALKVLRNLPMPAERAKPKQEDGEEEKDDGEVTLY
jgi:double-stranded RNA-binding protein Staufen